MRGPAAEAAGRALAALGAAAPRARWYSPDTLHVTAAFLGETPPERVPELRAVSAAAEAAAPSPVEAELCSLGAFPSWDAPRVVWAGVGRGAGEMSALAAALRPRLVAAGFPVEDRTFVPHLTLGRLKERRLGPAVRAAAAPWNGAPAWAGAVFTCGPVRLFSSVLTPAGAVHTEVPA